LEYIYQPKSGQLLRVGFLFSGGASSLKSAFRSHLHGVKYEIVFALTDNQHASGIEFCKDMDLPLIVADYKQFCEKYSVNQRTAYFQFILEKIEGFSVDILGLSGFMLIITDPLLSTYYNRILNIHPFRLDILTGPRVERLEVGSLRSSEVLKLARLNKLVRKYKGKDAVYDGMISGEPYAQSTLHLVTEAFDEGPILVCSKKIYFDQKWVQKNLKSHNFRPLRTKADAIQEMMKWECDGPAFIKGLELIADGRFGIDGFTIFLDGEELPYSGYQLE